MWATYAVDRPDEDEVRSAEGHHVDRMERVDTALLQIRHHDGIAP